MKKEINMLVLTRNEGQSIKVGDHIEVHISEINGSQVKVAINAPREVKILRSELVVDLRSINTKHP